MNNNNNNLNNTNVKTTTTTTHTSTNANANIHGEDVPTSKAGEIYHKAAAKMADWRGDEASKAKHEALVQEKMERDRIEEQMGGSSNMHSSGGAMMGGNNTTAAGYSSTGMSNTSGINNNHSNVNNNASNIHATHQGIQEANHQQAPTTKVGEMYHQTAAKMADMRGDQASKAKHETLVQEKRANDLAGNNDWSNNNNSMGMNNNSGMGLNNNMGQASTTYHHQSTTTAAGGLGAQSHNFNSATHSSNTGSGMGMGGSSLNNSEPTTKAGELYHQGAAKMAEWRGDEASRAKHETLVESKQAKDAMKENMGMGAGSSNMMGSSNIAANNNLAGKSSINTLGGGVDAKKTTTTTTTTQHHATTH